MTIATHATHATKLRQVPRAEGLALAAALAAGVNVDLTFESVEGPGSLLAVDGAGAVQEVRSVCDCV